MRNVHARRVAAPLERVRPWIEACWSGADRDCFPRDVIRSWRRNPDGIDPLALVPGTTLLGHGPFRFRLRVWDGRAWRVDVVGRPGGWHGLDLAPDGDGCWITHTLELENTLSARLGWLAIEPIHDWAVEALFDRIEEALRTGVVPARTTRPMSRLAAVALALARRARFRSRRARTAAAGEGPPRTARP
jgi:hypothetical protein